MSRFLLAPLLCLLLACTNTKKPAESPRLLRYLALGDSYTIGTAIGADSSYSAMLAKKLGSRCDTLHYRAIAQNGWTTTQLQAALDTACLDSNFHLVTLLIGVNNQYEGLPLARYRQELVALLQQGLALASGQKEKLLLLSIPDYGVTPAARNNSARIAAELDRYNAVQKALCDSLQLRFVDITGLSRRALHKPKWIAADSLHFSPAMHRLWLNSIYAVVDTLPLP